MSANEHRSFDDVRANRERHVKGCPRCGAEHNAGSVGAILSQLKPTGERGKRVASRTKSFCEPCAIEVYDLLVEVILREARVDVEAST